MKNSKLVLLSLIHEDPEWIHDDKLRTWNNVRMIGYYTFLYRERMRTGMMI